MGEVEQQVEILSFRVTDVDPSVTGEPAGYAAKGSPRMGTELGDTHEHMHQQT